MIFFHALKICSLLSSRCWKQLESNGQHFPFVPRSVLQVDFSWVRVATPTSNRVHSIDWSRIVNIPMPPFHSLPKYLANRLRLGSNRHGYLELSRFDRFQSNHRQHCNTPFTPLPKYLANQLLLVLNRNGYLESSRFDLFESNRQHFHAPIYSSFKVPCKSTSPWVESTRLPRIELIRVNSSSTFP